MAGEIQLAKLGAKGVGYASDGLTALLRELAERGGNVLDNFGVWNKGNKAVFNEHIGNPEQSGRPRVFYRGVDEDSYNGNAWPVKLLYKKPGELPYGIQDAAYKLAKAKLGKIPDPYRLREYLSPSELAGLYQDAGYGYGGGWYGTNERYARSYALKKDSILEGKFDYIPEVKDAVDSLKNWPNFTPEEFQNLVNLSYRYPELAGPVREVYLQQRKPFVLDTTGYRWYDLGESELILPEKYYKDLRLAEDRVKPNVTMYPDSIKSKEYEQGLADLLGFKRSLNDRARTYYNIDTDPHPILSRKVTFNDFLDYDSLVKGTHYYGGPMSPRDAFETMRDAYAGLADELYEYGISNSTYLENLPKKVADYYHPGYPTMVDSGIPVDDISTPAAKTLHLVGRRGLRKETNDVANYVSADPSLGDSVTLENLYHHMSNPSSEHIITRGPQVKTPDSGFNYRSPIVTRAILGGSLLANDASESTAYELMKKAQESASKDDKKEKSLASELGAAANALTEPMFPSTGNKATALGTMFNAAPIAISTLAAIPNPYAKAGALALALGLGAATDGAWNYTFDKALDMVSNGNGIVPEQMLSGDSDYWEWD